MESKGLVYSGGDSMAPPQKLKFASLEQRPDSVFPSAPSNSFLGSRTMVSFGALDGLKRSGNLLFGCFDQNQSGDEYSDEYYFQPEKKKRLMVDQVQFLEKSFELENKLEPGRKVQLAKELGLQPRQIAVWFQNRRARWKTKQLETEYETLHASYEGLKTGYNNLLKENEMLKAEVLHLKGSGLHRDLEKAALYADEEQFSEATPKLSIANSISENEEYIIHSMGFRCEEQTSTVSDVNSVHLTDQIHSQYLESGEPSHACEPYQTELLQIEENGLNEELLPCANVFLTIEDAYCHLSASPSSFGYPIEDHAFGFWSL